MNQDYSSHYSEQNLKSKLKNVVHRVGHKALRQVMILVALLKSDNVPTLAKAAIIAALGYLIFPFDLLPDWLPGGLADDLAVISLLLFEMSVYRTPAVEEEAQSMIDRFSK